VLVGFETADDAGVFRLDDERALVQTLDFFAPVVDDPYTYGAIAAANSLSDIYAMGGIPLTALAITCFPDRQEQMDLLSQIMLGGADKLLEARVALIGGHTMCDQEIKFGYSVTGLVHPGRILTNAGALPGDALILTKPLGIGIISTAIKRALVDAATIARAVEVMTTLNRAAAEAIRGFRCHAVTDITGFGLLGHGCEMAEASKVTLRLHSRAIPFLPEAYPLAEARVLPGLLAKNWKQVEPHVVLGPSIEGPLLSIMLDPQTSGGLLVSIHPEDRDRLLRDLAQRGVQATQIGGVEAGSGIKIIVD
jgi:selenide, water dikinase